jgi:uncharacterized protein HemY
MMLAKTTTEGALRAPASSLVLAAIPAETQKLLLRMFADPYLLEKHQSAGLVRQLRECVAQHPKVSALRVLLGMALCVNLEPQAAIEELREAVALDPNSFIAHLKLGELWMRLRVCERAQDHTRQASILARNLAQSELARRQAASLRTMMREGIERGGYQSVWTWVKRLRRPWRRDPSLASAALDLS